MRKVRLIYNPSSGDTSFKQKLDYVVEVFQAKGLQVVPHRSFDKKDIRGVIRRMKNETYYGLAVAGGDGTIHEVINAMAEEQVQVPLSVIPAGTANDFAAHINTPREIEKIAALIAEGHYRAVDLGKANDRYFVNVASAGLLTDVSHTVDTNFKNVLGKLAYYLKGVEQLPNFRSIPFQIESNEVHTEEELFLFLVLNGSCAGGFSRIVPAYIDDGLLDVIAIRKCSLPHLVTLMLKILRGEHLLDRRVLYFQTKEVLFKSFTPLSSDLDGERGPDLPLQVRVCPGNLKVFVNRQD
jgi:YegS/Rv2252/BmrU family lipid kinase